ncbi:hypothetical protein [Natranaeroarchaeum sulfidigenes]|nr:hypothetical protein [Natranaeroarchaeum sulfidigenes]
MSDSTAGLHRVSIARGYGRRVDPIRGPPMWIAKLPITDLSIPKYVIHG